MLLEELERVWKFYMDNLMSGNKEDKL